MKPVLVIWHDAHAACQGWEYLDDLEDDGDYVVKSIGYLIDSKKYGKKKHISIAQSFSEQDCVDSILHIPKAMVQKIINLIEEQPTIKEKIILNLTERNKNG